MAKTPDPTEERTTSTGYLILALVISGKIEYKEGIQAVNFLHELGKRKKLQKKEYAKSFLHKFRKKSSYSLIKDLFEEENT